ncbi:hypothetical protein PAXRUDRAFT_37069 [Paxillus rubicundulus Ve08.2h10]|uniref:Unplaced genomic scaffold scaffold_4746, whole genome shotgun sequence n=1 Tax=Paxillus rubicundulus Ve08.2h10 TaxID=930991 RepID=A0A0D0BQ22_9AGAM|nr:hypothetical protein PAXRUDRAFT_37069 [Paxillus rubicundulus Ve08.2h10]
MKLITERDSVSTLFKILATAVKLPETEPTKFNPETLLQMSSPRPVTSMDRLSKETHSAIRFWDEINFLEWAESPAFQVENQGKLPYLEQENGNPIPEETVCAMRKVLRGAWSELVQRKLAPLTWGKFSTTGWDLVHGLMEAAFPFLWFTNNGWKVKQMATKTYSSLHGRHVDDNGNWKSKKSQQDLGDEDDVDEDDTGDPEDSKLKMKKCKRKHAKSEAPYKRFKASHNNQPPLLVLPVLRSPSPPQVQLPVLSADSAPAISMSLSTRASPMLASPSKAPTPQVLASPKSTNQFQAMVSVPLDLDNENKENEDPNSKTNDLRAKKQIVNPLAALAATTTKAKLSLVPLPEVPSQSRPPSPVQPALTPAQPNTADSAKHNPPPSTNKPTQDVPHTKKNKMCPGSGKNGCLTEVTLLGASKAWDSKTIARGTMY